MTERLSPHRLRERLLSKGIKAVLFDFDDTLIDTNKLFRNRINQFVHSVVEKNPNLDWKDVREKLSEFNNANVRARSVRQDNLPKTAGDLDEYFGTFPIFTNHSEILEHIYVEAPELMDGTIDILDALRDAGIPVGLVTHAAEEWTNIKVDSHNLRKYFTHIQIADITVPKGSEDWRKAIEAMGFKPEEVLVVGDNLKGDIIAATSIGVKYTFWIESSWDLYREGEVPESTERIKNIREIYDSLVSL